MGERRSKAIDILQVEKCHAALKKLMLSMRYIDKIMVPGLDVPLISWECSRDLKGRGFRMQATQIDEPKMEEDAKIDKLMFDVVRGEMVP